MTDGLHITITDVRLAGFCVSGVKRWFDGQPIDFRAFLKNGVTADELLATGDAMAARVVAAKIKREWLDGSPEGIIITVDDMRASSQCAGGSRAFAAKAGLDWQSFLNNGIPAMQLIASGDPVAVRVVRDKMERERGRG